MSSPVPSRGARSADGGGPGPTPVRASPQLTVIPARYSPGPAVLGLQTLLAGDAEVAVIYEQPGAASLEPEGAPTRPGLGPPAVPGPQSSARNALVMAMGTALSRLSGFARVLAVIWVLGQSNLSDAYNLANTLPNIVYELLLGGVLSATLLPVLMQSLARRALDRDDTEASAVVTFLAVVLLVGTGLFWLAAPLLMHLYLALASGPRAGPERALATSWLRYFAPQLFFIGLTAISNALLNARRRFGAVAFSPIVANVVTIVALVVADHIVQSPSVAGYRADGTAIAVVGLGTTGGYLLQFLVQLPALRRCKLHLRPVWRPSEPALRTIARLSGWTLGVVAANQLSYSVNAVLANIKGGNLSAYTYAYTFMQLPYAVIAVSIAYAVAPDLAHLWARARKAEFAGRVSYAVRVVLVLLVPGGTGYCLLAHPVMSVLSAHGQESLSKAALTGSLLAIFALGLPGFSAYLLLMRAFQAKQDTRSMFWLYLVENGLTVAGALVLYPFLGVRGLAASWIGCYTLVLPLAWRKLRQSAPITISGGWLSRLVLCTGVMAVAVSLLLRAIPVPHALLGEIGRLFLVSGLGGAVLWAASIVFGVEELSELVSRLRSLAR